MVLLILALLLLVLIVLVNIYFSGILKSRNNRIQELLSKISSDLGVIEELRHTINTLESELGSTRSVLYSTKDQLSITNRDKENVESMLDQISKNTIKVDFDIDTFKGKAHPETSLALKLTSILKKIDFSEPSSTHIEISLFSTKHDS